MLAHIAEWAIGTGLTIGIALGAILLIVKRNLSRARTHARERLPAVGEVWMMDGEPLYIKAVAKHGVLLVVGVEGELHSWWDTWDDWRTRLNQRVVLRTEQKVTKPEGT